MKKVAIIGVVGVPANYGGFETLVENIIGENASEDVEYTIRGTLWMNDRLLSFTQTTGSWKQLPVVCCMGRQSRALKFVFSLVYCKHSVKYRY